MNGGATAFQGEHDVVECGGRRRRCLCGRDDGGVVVVGRGRARYVRVASQSGSMHFHGTGPGGVVVVRRGRAGYVGFAWHS